MDARLLAAVTSSLEGVNVTELCKQHGISRKTFYKWRKRYGDEGLAGLYEQSRRPQNLAAKLPDSVGDDVVRLRAELIKKGLDAGPISIGLLMEKRGAAFVPSDATIWRILVDKELITPQPRKRPKSSYVRFEADFPNECWQIDFTEWPLANGKIAYIFNIIDDHSRLGIGSLVVAHATTEKAWEAFSSGVEQWGLPTRCLSDNGLAFSGKLKNYIVFFETQLRKIGVRPITSRPYHPQTCGKVERFQQTLKKWLSSRPPAKSVAQLQRQLDRFYELYNFDRPHQGIGRITPHERWSRTKPIKVRGIEIPDPVLRTTTICTNGLVDSHGWRIGIGAEFTGRPSEVVIDGTLALVFIDGKLIRALELDATRKYQPTGRSPGRRTKAS